MVTGVGLADAEGTEPIVKKAIIHSAIAAEIILLCRIIDLFMFVFIFVCGYLFVDCCCLPLQTDSQKGAARNCHFLCLASFAPFC